MTVTAMTKAQQKVSVQMSMDDLLTDEQKAARLAATHEEWNKDNYDTLTRKVASARKELVEFATNLAETAASTTKSPLWELNRRSVFEAAVKVEVFSASLALYDPAQSYTAWVKAVKAHALKEALRVVRNSCSTSMLDNYVEADKADLWRRMYEGFYF